MNRQLYFESVPNEFHPELDFRPGEMGEEEWWGETGSTASTATRRTAATMPAGPFGSLATTIPGRQPFTYQFTAEDVLWTARFLVGEAGGRDDPGNQAVIWAMFNRYALFTHRVYRTFHQFIRAYSTPLQPVLKSKGAAKRHAHKPEFVKTGGTYEGTDIPKGQLARFLELQRTPWSRLPASARSLAERAMKGLVPNPIGNASEFASTKVYFKDRHKRFPRDFDEWRGFTEAYARSKKWRWVGPLSGLNQMSNAFFIDQRAVNLAPGSIRVTGGAPAIQPETSWPSSIFPPLSTTPIIDRTSTQNCKLYKAEPEMELISDLETYFEEAEFNLYQFPYPVLKMLNLGLESTAVKLAVVYGNRNEVQLTDLVFNTRHPERSGRALSRSESGYASLASEWVKIRATIVRPALRSVGSHPAASPVPTPSPTTPTGRPDVVKVREITVARQIAPQITKLLAAADADGVRLSGGGFRTPEEQIELRRQHCGPTHYDIYDKPAKECKPPTANPGRSNHERGLAIDFTYNGALIETHNNPGFQWLAANAARFGLKNLPSEAWHWSVDGR